MKTLLVLVCTCFLLIAGCEKEISQQPPADPSKQIAPTNEAGPDDSTEDVRSYRLTYLTEGKGRIDGPGEQKVEHGADAIQVTAVPEEGYNFVQWSDGLMSSSRTDREVASDLEVTAVFEINQYVLSYDAGKNGRLEGTAVQFVEHGSRGSEVTAVAAPHYHFVRWTDGVKTARRVDDQVQKDLSVVAEFAIDQYPLTYTAGENGEISGATRQMVDHGGRGTPVTAVPDEGYHFAGWSDGVTTASRTDSKVVAARAVTAEFAINRYPLTYEAGEYGAIEGNPQQEVEHGGDGSEVRAVAEKGYHFVSWSDGVETPERTDLKVSGPISVQALFEINTYLIGGTLSGLVEGTTVTLLNSGGDPLVLSADGEFTFPAEVPNGTEYAVSVQMQPESPNQTCTPANASGTISEQDVTDIEVSCVINTYSVGGVVSGLPEGNRVGLRNNDGDDLLLMADGAFSFSTPLEDGSPYEVAVFEQPEKQNYTCDVINPAGELSGSPVEDIVIDCYPQVVLQAIAGNREVQLSWNTQDFKKTEFSLCRAEAPIDGEFAHCEELDGGVLASAGGNPWAIAPLKTDRPYWFQMEAHYGDRRTLSEVIKAVPFGGLNDTGIDWCSDDARNRDREGTRVDKATGCRDLLQSYPGQDGHQGRDASARARELAKSGYGSGGFDFTKVCRSGEVAGEGKCAPNPSLGDGPNNWGCTQDNATGLLWEVKTEKGLHGYLNTYSWYNPDETTNGGGAGLQDGGKCEGSACDTLSYVEAVNAKGLCGVSDWRLPTRRELLSIVDNGKYNPAADQRFFPHSSSAHFWSSTPFPDDQSSAWQVYFLYGEADANEKKQGRHLRLVRGKTATFGLENP